MRDPTSDSAFSALADSHRRELLFALLGHTPQAELSIPEGVEFDEEELEAVRLKMYHFHLPRLESEGFIEWNRDTRSVSKGPDFEEIRPLLKLLDRHRNELPDGWF